MSRLFGGTYNYEKSEKNKKDQHMISNVHLKNWKKFSNLKQATISSFEFVLLETTQKSLPSSRKTVLMMTKEQNMEENMQKLKKT